MKRERERERERGEGGLPDAPTLPTSAFHPLAPPYLALTSESTPFPAQIFLRRFDGGGGAEGGGSKPYMTAAVTGEGANPAILFDRNEVWARPAGPHTRRMPLGQCRTGPRVPPSSSIATR